MLPNSYFLHSPQTWAANIHGTHKAKRNIRKALPIAYKHQIYPRSKNTHGTHAPQTTIFAFMQVFFYAPQMWAANIHNCRTSKNSTDIKYVEDEQKHGTYTCDQTIYFHYLCFLPTNMLVKHS